jgi:hypothetical protein
LLQQRKATENLFCNSLFLWDVTFMNGGLNSIKGYKVL